HARLADVTPRARDAVVAAGAVGLGRVGARARRGVAGPGVVALVWRVASHRVHPGADPRLTGVRLRAGVPVIARRAVRTRVVGRAIVRRAVTALQRVTLPRGGAAHLGLLGVRRAAVVRAVAPLLDVAQARCRAADVCLLRVGGAGGVGAGAGLRRVAHPGRCPTLGARSLEPVRRAGVVCAVAPLVDVARAGRLAADVRLLHVGGAGGVGAGAGLRRVADAGRCPTLGARGLETVRGAGVVRPVAALFGVADAGRCAADVGLLHIGRARGAGAGAELRRVADAGRGATHGGGGLEAIDGAGVVRAVAPLLHVARARRRAADVGLLRVGGARGVRAVAGLGGVADTRGGTTDHAGRLEAVRGAVVARAVAALLGVARSRGRPADVRLLDVGGARSDGPGAGRDRVPE